MFSHVLVAYQAALLDFATKTSFTFQSALKILEEKPQYSFTILKDLTQVPVVRDNQTETKEVTPLDFAEMLFFKVLLLAHLLAFGICGKRTKQSKNKEEEKKRTEKEKEQMPHFITYSFI